jgi:hypothetical protein
MKPGNSWPKILDALTTPKAAHQLAPEVCLAQRTVANLLRQLHDEGLVHIAKWVHRAPPGPYTPVYAFGPGTDASCPRPQPKSVRQKMYRARLTRTQRESILQRRRTVKADIAASWIK